MPIDPNLILTSQIYGPNGSDRLSRFDIARDFGFDFHSLVWERRSADGWHDHMSLTQEQFQGTHDCRRFVSGLHSFDPQRGWAAIQIGEGNRPQGSFVVTFFYSWRTWDIVNNQEIGLLKKCESPFDTLD